MLINKNKSKRLLKSILKEKKIQKYLELLKYHHKETHDHSIRVGLLSVRMGYKNSFSKKSIKRLAYAGLLHDLGKLNIPNEILSNGSKLNGYEKKIMNGHPRLAFLKLRNFKGGDVRKIIIGNHEYGIQPYPRKKIDRRKNRREGEERRTKHVGLDKLAQIIALADMYDALSHKRSYKKALSKGKIVKIMKKEFKGDRIYLEQIFEL